MAEHGGVPKLKKSPNRPKINHFSIETQDFGHPPFYLTPYIWDHEHGSRFHSQVVSGKQGGRMASHPVFGTIGGIRTMVSPSTWMVRTGDFSRRGGMCRSRPTSMEGSGLASQLWGNPWPLKRWWICSSPGLQSPLSVLKFHCGNPVFWAVYTIFF